MQAVHSVMIVGAGSAGWLTALVLNTYCPGIQVTLVRPGNSAPVGVGESTQLDFLRLLQAARVDLQDFYRRCDATMKCGIFYRDWNVPGDHYWHPFSNLAYTGSYTAAHYYQQMILRQPENFSHAGYYAAVHTSYDTCVNRNQVAPESAVAFHVDALKITTYFESILDRVRVVDTASVEVMASDGRVSGVKLAEGGQLDADLYIDCTGFARALHGKVATPDIVAYTANVNRAVAARVPYADRSAETFPYTRAHAHEHGWTWSIPLSSRIGSGYVYHDDFCSPEEAETAFRQYWGVDRMKNVDVQHIRFDSPSLRNPWAANVVTIGLSAGFVEPLEATGLNWTITSALTLSQSLSSRYFDGDTASKYNFNMLGYIYDVHDFIDVHYLLSARRDSEFWRWQTSREMPERLKLRLDQYKEEMPNDANRLKTTPWAFNEVSWLDILNAYGFRYAALDIHPAQEEKARRSLSEIQGRSWKGVSTLDWLPPRESR